MVTDKKKIEPLCEQATCTIIGAAIEHHGEQDNRLCGAPRTLRLRVENQEQRKNDLHVFGLRTGT